MLKRKARTLLAELPALIMYENESFFGLVVMTGCLFLYWAMLFFFFLRDLI